jgi:PepSY-associated TM region
MLKRSLIFLHRWLGVALCLLFLVWFPSGIGMMYWEFPSVTPEMRLDRAAPLRAADVRLAPADAWATLGEAGAPSRARLQILDGRPLYRFQTRAGERLVYGDTGERRGDVSAEHAGRIASDWTGQTASAATVVTLDDADQWTVPGSFRSLRPLWKYSWPNGEQVYVSPRSGEVVQYTTRSSRVGAYLGPIPHWLYFTPLRKHQSRWSNVVIYTSGIGTVSAMLGVIVGFVVLSPSKRYRDAGRPTRIPYAGYKRWHMVLGLLAGAGAITWAYSGMLSMDPYPATQRTADAEAARETVQRALRAPISLDAFEATNLMEAISAAPGVKEIELLSIGGTPAYLAHMGGGDTRVVTLDGRVERAIDDARLRAIVARASASAGSGPAEFENVTAYDRYYLDRRGRLPLPVLLARLNDADETRYYIDPRTARVVGSYSAAEWSSRWLYHGLHSLDFPWLYNHRPAWDIVVILFMLAGTALSVTSLVRACRVVTRSVRL